MGLPNLPAWGGGAGPPAEWGHESALLMRGILPPPCLPSAHCVLQWAEEILDGDVYAFKNVKIKFLRWLHFLRHVCIEQVRHVEP